MALRSAMRGLIDAGLRPFGLETRPMKHVAASPGSGPWFEEDTLRAKRTTEFLLEPDFVRAYDRAMRAGGADFKIRWRTHVAIWAARSALAVPGDFVELGTGRGWMFSAILTSIDWNEQQRNAYLFDRFVDSALDRKTGELLTEKENDYRRYYADSIDQVRENFAEWHRVNLVQGDLPASLSKAPLSKVAFLHVDLNAADPEIESMEALWGRLSPGAVVLLDDHAFTSHRDQYDAHRSFVTSRGADLLVLPTGQGLILRSGIR